MPKLLHKILDDPLLASVSDLIIASLEKKGVSLEIEESEIDKRKLSLIANALIDAGLDLDKSRRFFQLLLERLRSIRTDLVEEISPKIRPRISPPELRTKDFREIVEKIDLHEAIREAKRCLTCSPPRCVNACPLSFSIPAFLRIVAMGKIEQAYRVGLRFTPLLGVCGRICVAYCQKACTLNRIGLGPVSVRSVKRAVADNVDKYGNLPAPRPKKHIRVAVIGSGPAGLTAAYHLRLMGYSVTVFESSENVGGMLGQSIPDYRLPKNVLEEEVEILRRIGVRFLTGVEVGRELGINELFRRGFKAIFISTGAHRSARPRIPGIELNGIYDALDFLKKAKKGDLKKLKGRVWVVGGGDVAIDSARTALRLGADKVKIIYRRSRSEMPAEDEYIDRAVEEGVEIMFLACPVRFLGDGRVREMECIRMMLGEVGADGRRKPVPIKGSEFIVKADHVILAVGQKPETGWIRPEDGIELTENGLIKVDERYSTSREGVFAGGDAVRGPSTFAYASGDGLKAAHEIDRFLQRYSTTTIT